MKKSMVKKLLALSLSSFVVAGSLAGCGSSQTTEDSSQTSSGAVEEQKSTDTAEETTPTNAEAVTIRWGNHNMTGIDPYYVDEATGEYTMPEAQRQAALAALAKVKDEMNVDIEFIVYAQDVRNELLTSVLAGNPVCDIAGIWGGAEATILAQNIMQPLD